MSRDEFVKKVRAFAAHMAEVHGCDVMMMDEDRQKGIWGERMTAWLEKENGGDCSTNIKWTGGDAKTVRVYDKKPRPERCVEFRFRFSSPCVSVSLDHRKLFAGIEFSDYGHDDGELVHTGEFELYEVHAWGDGGGFGLLSNLLAAWYEFDAKDGVREIGEGA